MMFGIIFFLPLLFGTSTSILCMCMLLIIKTSFFSFHSEKMSPFLLLLSTSSFLSFAFLNLFWVGFTITSKCTTYVGILCKHFLGQFNWIIEVMVEQLIDFSFEVLHWIQNNDSCLTQQVDIGSWLTRHSLRYHQIHTAHRI